MKLSPPVWMKELGVLLIGAAAGVNVFVYTYRAAAAVYSRPPLAAWQGKSSDGGREIPPNRLAPQMDINNARLRVENAIRHGDKPSKFDIDFLRKNVKSFDLNKLRTNVLRGSAASVVQRVQTLP